MLPAPESSRIPLGGVADKAGFTGGIMRVGRALDCGRRLAEVIRVFVILRCIRISATADQHRCGREATDGSRNRVPRDKISYDHGFLRFPLRSRRLGTQISRERLCSMPGSRLRGDVNGRVELLNHSAAVVGEPIYDQLPFLVMVQKSFGKEQSQVLRHGGDRFAEDLGNVAHAAVFDAEDMQDRQACGMPQDLPPPSGNAQFTSGRQLFFECSDLVCIETDDGATPQRFQNIAPRSLCRF
jgi:hypothetical protein